MFGVVEGVVLLFALRSRCVCWLLADRPFSSLRTAPEASIEHHGNVFSTSSPPRRTISLRAPFSVLHFPLLNCARRALRMIIIAARVTQHRRVCISRPSLGFLGISFPRLRGSVVWSPEAPAGVIDLVRIPAIDSQHCSFLLHFSFGIVFSSLCRLNALNELESNSSVSAAFDVDGRAFYFYFLGCAHLVGCFVSNRDGSRSDEFVLAVVFLRCSLSGWRLRYVSAHWLLFRPRLCIGGFFVFGLVEFSVVVALGWWE